MNLALGGLNMSHPFGDRAIVEGDQFEDPVLLDSFGGKLHVRWAPDEAVTPLGQLPFFIDYLKQADLFDPFVADCPMSFTSPNAPKVRDILGTMVLSIVTGGRRYSHVNALRHDGINPGLLGMGKICSDDSVRRALVPIEEHEAETWLKHHLTFPLHPVMQEDWILDTDATVKPIYGKQEGAVVGYNPQKPGRPSHSYHSYMIANLRLMLGVDVLPGNEHHGSHGLSGLLEILDGLTKETRPYLVRGDASYGSEAVMSALEARDQNYLFKLRMTRKVSELAFELAGTPGWIDAGRGWQAASSDLQLQGWSRKRRVVVLRRPLPKDTMVTTQPNEDGDQLVLGLSEALSPDTVLWEYSVLATSLDCEARTLAQLYRDRADAENVFDELKNQWGWGGFTTRDLKRTRITARMTAIVYNWWSLFVRLVDPLASREATTSRPLLLTGVARASSHAGQTTLFFNSSHSQAKLIQAKLSNLVSFLRKLQNTPQLSAMDRWCQILGRALSKYLHGKNPKPPPNLLSA